MGETSAQPKYKRQRFLLSFVSQINNGVTATDLQKLVFLHTMAGQSNYYKFIPYKFGSFSFQLKDDLDILQRNGFLAFDYLRHGIIIRANCEYPTEVVFQIPRERGDALIRRAYREYPYYAINSEITNKLFYGEELEQFNRSKPDYSQTEQVLFTIGYEGKGIEEFINILIENCVHLLCDVRNNPLSRKFGFSKRKLEHITNTVGIRYAHLPDLGIASEKRCSLESREDYLNLFNDYEKTLFEKKDFINEVYKMLEKNNRIALMCFEHEPFLCHRHVLRDYLVKENRVKSVDLK